MAVIHRSLATARVRDKLRGGGRKRWAGFNPQNPLDFTQRRFGFRPANTTKDD